MFNFDNKIKPFEKKIWLASPTMHGDEKKFVDDAFTKNWITTEGDNVRGIEISSKKKTHMKYCVALSNCTAAIHMAVRAAGEKLYGKPETSKGTLVGKKVFCTDMTFDATANPICYEGGIPIFVDTDPESWNMDPVALEKAFKIYPDVKLVIVAELYGFPGKLKEIKEVCEKHEALLIEDAAEALGAKYQGKQCGSFGDYGTISFNGNKIITGSAGGCFLTNDEEIANKVKKWSTQSRETAPWYQHVDLGYNYRMSNIVAGVALGQFPYLNEHIKLKKAIYNRYKKAFEDLPVKMNPVIEGANPNYWLSAITIDEEFMCKQERTDDKATYVPEYGKSCPTEILEALKSINSEGRPIWKPMHLEPIYENNEFVKINELDIGKDIFTRGLCLPSDIKMTPKEQKKIIEVVKRCFD